MCTMVKTVALLSMVMQRYAKDTMYMKYPSQLKSPVGFYIKTFRKQHSVSQIMIYKNI